MIKGVNFAPSKASLSPEKASQPTSDLVHGRQSKRSQTTVSNSSSNHHDRSDQATSAHVAVLLHEAVDALAIKPTGIYVDGTFGRGGHSRRILSRLGESGRLIAFDRDLAAIASGNEIKDARFTIIHSPFMAIQEKLLEVGISRVDGILLDLGISSPQIDDADRGFSFRFDAPLDMRMDQSSGETAAEFLGRASEQQLMGVIKNYGEERFAKSIARAIIKERDDGHPITTTGRLAQVVASVVTRFEPGQNPATRTFQALRIFINQELEGLSLTLPQCVDLLHPQGRLAVISFHSLEDRLVKQFIREQEDRDDLPAHFPVRAADLPQPRLRGVGKSIKPSRDEVAQNPRSRSAVLRVAERTISI
ncbi:MAG: 16S rRNA (cytosine(1402)-N(4))-methyltransferase RsmH [Betaproteobacteria bacterium]|nr:16S rRNA (cytosine(1402)-N(4))-methyltransferase RsmH [Betaproteobacteria bacterium]